MSRSTVRSALALAVMSLAGVGASSAYATDTGTIRVQLDFPSGSGPEGNQYHRLRGQSVFFQQRTSSGTSGGQLDGVSSFSSATLPQEISFTEIFPEVNLTDYLRFGYFGVIETVEIDMDGNENVLDTSFVVAGQGLSSTVVFEDLFPSLTEDSLVTALTTNFDSPEFFTAFDTVTNSGSLSGQIALAITGVGNVRAGDTLTLYAFSPSGGDPTGLTPQDVGFLEFTMERVPTPSAAALLGIAGLMASRRRR